MICDSVGIVVICEEGKRRGNLKERLPRAPVGSPRNDKLLESKDQIERRLRPFCHCWYG